MIDTVGVVVPAHRNSDALERSIAAILNQSRPVQEIIVVDDGSPQPIPFHKDSRVKVLRLPKNSGSPALPRWLGTLEASTDWIAFCDSDDEWLPEKIEVQMHGLGDTPGIRAVSSNAISVSDHHSEVRFFPEPLPSVVTRRNLISRNWIVTSSMVVDRSLLLRCGWCNHPPSDVYEDLALWLRVSCLTHVRLVDWELVKYRDSPKTSHRSKYGSPGIVLARTLQDASRWARGNGYPYSLGDLAVAAVAVTRQVAADASGRSNVHEC